MTTKISQKIVMYEYLSKKKRFFQKLEICTENIPSEICHPKLV